MSDEWQAYLKDTRRICKYGVKCYQKNPEHQNKFKHPPQQIMRNAANNKNNKVRFNPYARNEESVNVHRTADNKETKESTTTTASDADTSTIQDAVYDNNPLPDDKIITTVIINNNTQYLNGDSNHDIFKECFLVDMPPDFFKFYQCLKTVEGSFEKLLSTVNLQLIGPFDLLSGKLPMIDDKHLYLIHWRFFYDPPEFQAVLKKRDKSQFHIGYFRDSPSETPAFLAANDSEKDCVIKPIASNIFAAVYWYLQQEKKTSPFVSVACQKFMEKISTWAKQHDYTLKEFNMKSRQMQTVCRSFHGAGIVVPYNKKTQLGYRSLVESDAKLRNLFQQLEEANSQDKRDKILSEIQPVITYANIAVDECDFGTGLEAGVAMFCSGRKELEPVVLSSLCAVYSLLNRAAFSKIIQSLRLDFKSKDVICASAGAVHIFQEINDSCSKVTMVVKNVHMKHRRKGPDMSIINQ